MPGYQSTLVEAQVDGAALTNVVTESPASPTAVGFLPSTCKIVLPAGYMNRIGKRFLIRSTGRISTVVTTPGTLTMRFKLGAAGTTTVAASTAWPLNSTIAKTNVGWFLDLGLTVRTIGPGTTATIFAQGSFTSESVFSSAAGTANSVCWQSATPAVGPGFDSTIANQIDLTAQFSVATATTSIQMHTFALEDLTTTP